MSIWTGKGGYESIEEFTERTRRELLDREGVIYRRDTEPPLDVVQWVLAHLDGAKTVLELGSGFGVWLQVATAEGATYEGVEPVAARVIEAIRLRPGGTFHHADARKVRLYRLFDRVLTVTVLQHLSLHDAIAVLRTAEIHLAPEGQIVLLESMLLDVAESEAERMYSEPTCSPHMIPKPIGAFREALPELEWLTTERADGFVLRRRA